MGVYVSTHRHAVDQRGLAVRIRSRRGRAEGTTRDGRLRRKRPRASEGQLLNGAHLGESRSIESTCREAERRLAGACLDAGGQGTHSVLEMAPLDAAQSGADVPRLTAPLFSFSSELWSSSLLSESDVEVKSAGARPRLPLFESDFATVEEWTSVTCTEVSKRSL